MSADTTWDFLDPASKDRLLAALRRESDELFELVSDPAHWHAPTACTGWEVCDMVGHLIDATEASLAAFDIARTGVDAGAPLGLSAMANGTDDAARAFRGMPRDELLARMRARNAD